MLQRSRLSGFRPLFTALYAVAMLSLGFAHSHAGLPDTIVLQAAALQAAAFASLDSVWPPICGPSRPAAPALQSASVPCDERQPTFAPAAISPAPPRAGAPRVVSERPPVRMSDPGATRAVVAPPSRGPPLLS
jgi:hypothetical protein